MFRFLHFVSILTGTGMSINVISTKWKIKLLQYLKKNYDFNNLKLSHLNVTSKIIQKIFLFQIWIESLK